MEFRNVRQECIGTFALRKQILHQGREQEEKKISADPGDAPRTRIIVSTKFIFRGRMQAKLQIFALLSTTKQYLFLFI